MVANARDIEAFLTAFKAYMDQSGLNIWPTAKNNQFLLDAGFDNGDIEEIVRTLEVRHYENGPLTDPKAHRPNGDVWIFSREYYGYDLYIKLKQTASYKVIAECLSVHEAEFPMKQPMRAPK